MRCRAERAAGQRQRHRLLASERAVMLTVEIAWKVILAGNDCHGTDSICVFIVSLSVSSSAAPRSQFCFNARYWEPIGMAAPLPDPMP